MNGVVDPVKVGPTWVRLLLNAFVTIIGFAILSIIALQYLVWGATTGAAGKATMWVNACKMNYLGGVVDASPLRAGKLMPGTHTPIVFPDRLRETPPDYIFVSAWNYADLIRSKESWFRGVWSVPLPDLRFF